MYHIESDEDISCAFVMWFLKRIFSLIDLGDFNVRVTVLCLCYSSRICHEKGKCPRSKSREYSIDAEPIKVPICIRQRLTISLKQEEKVESIMNLLEALSDEWG